MRMVRDSNMDLKLVPSFTAIPLLPLGADARVHTFSPHHTQADRCGNSLGQYSGLGSLAQQCNLVGVLVCGEGDDTVIHASSCIAFASGWPGVENGKVAGREAERACDVGRLAEPTEREKRDGRKSTRCTDDPVGHYKMGTIWSDTCRGGTRDFVRAN